MDKFSSLYAFYFASPMREGIINWYPFSKESSVIENSGGVLTNLLNSRCKAVAQLEDDKYYRDKFDYVVVVDPHEITIESLNKYRSLQTAHGRLLLAFENPYGLQYFAGKRNRKAGVPFAFSRCWSKAEISYMLKQSGFNGQKWYYPFTNHYFAREIYSENYLPNASLNNRGYVFLEDDYTKEFDERDLWKEVIRNGAFEFLCHSYLVEARVCADDAPCDVDFAAITAYRESDKAFVTTIHDSGQVRKRAVFDSGNERLCEIANNHRDLIELGVNALPVTVENNGLTMKRIELPTLWDYLTERLTTGDLDEQGIISLYDKLRDSVVKSAKNGRCYWELVPANCFYDIDKDELIFFDQEYYWENVDPDVALVRGIYALKYSPIFQKCECTESWIEALKQKYNLTEKWDELSQIADSKTWEFIFGNEQTWTWDKSVRRAKARIDERIVERKLNSRSEHARFKIMCDVVSKLKRKTRKHPVIYGYGKRGKMLRYALETNDIDVACIIDKQLPIVRGARLFASFEKISNNVKYDAIIVTPINIADEIVAELRTKTDCPVLTIKELLNE